jgi:hypothetical protein
MDKQLLKALDNLGNALEMLTDALQSKKEAKSDTAQTMQAGDFGKQLESINVGIKEIKADTQKILNNQQTIIDLQRKKDGDKKTGEFQETGEDKKKESNIRKGVQTILLIAIAVLAIGLAFKIVGKVDFLSVIALSLAILIIAVAFERVAKSGLKPKEAFMASITLGIMSLGILISSFILSKVQKITLQQFMSAVMIATLFYFIAPVMADIINRLQEETEISMDDGKSKKKMKTKKMSWNKLFAMVVGLPLIMIGMSLGIMLSSWILSKIRPMSMPQIITGILIAGMFTVVATGIKGLLHALTEETEVQAKGFGGKQKGIAMGKLLQLCLILPILMLSISAGITLSSWVLSMIKPISFAQALTAIAIALAFSVISFGLKGLLVSLALVLQLFGMGTMLKLAGIVVLILPAIALAITASSWILSKVRPLTFMQIIGALAITILFAIMSYVMPYLAAGIVIIDKLIGTKKLILIPLTLVAISAAIMLSSHILSKMADIPWMKILKILVYGIVMALVVTAFTPAVIFLGLLPLGSLIKGVIGIVLIATAIVLSSMILAKGKYDKPPKWSWTLQAALAFLVFAPAVVLLGMVPLPVMIMGLISVVLVATAIVLTSKILAKGKYDKYPPAKWTLSTLLALGPFALGMAFLGPLLIAVALGVPAVWLVAKTIVSTAKILATGKYEKFPSLEWTKSVTLSMGFFGAAMVGLGGLILGSLGLGMVALLAGREAVLLIAETTVEAADVLRRGSFVGGPKKEWAEGVSIALGAFSSVYEMLAANSFWSLFGMGGIGPNEFAAGIKVVTKGIVVAAKEFETNKAAFIDGPSPKWAKGVGLAIGAFAPVYGILLGQGRSTFDKIFGGPGPSVKDMKKAIIAISQGIVDAAYFFAKNTAPFGEGKYPSKKWGKGVGAAIGAFAPVFQVLSGKSWYQSSDKLVKSMGFAIREISRAIIDSGSIFQEATDAGVSFDKKNAPTKGWASGVAASIEAFGGVFEYMSANSGLFTGADEVVTDMTFAIRKISRAITDAAEIFSSVGESAWKSYPTTQWANSVRSVNEIMTDSGKYLIEQWGESGYEIGWGLVTMADKMDGVASWLKGSKSWEAPSKSWAQLVSWNMKFFSRLASYVYTTTDEYELDLLVNVAKKINKVARTLFSAKDAFDYNIPKNFMPNLRKNMLDFQSLVHELAKREQKGLLETISDSLGGMFGGDKDPIMQMADRMVALAKGYSALAQSLIMLGAAMNTVKAKNLTQLGSITRGLLGGSETGEGKQKKPGIVQSVKSSFTGFGGEEGEKKSKSGFEAPQKNKKNSIKYVSEKLEELITIMNKINNKASSIDSSVSKMADGKIKSEADGGMFGMDSFF